MKNESMFDFYGNKDEVVKDTEKETTQESEFDESE